MCVLAGVSVGLVAHPRCRTAAAWWRPRHRPQVQLGHEGHAGGHVGDTASGCALSSKRCGVQRLQLIPQRGWPAASAAVVSACASTMACSSVICARASSACVSARLPLVVDRSTTLLRWPPAAPPVTDGLHLQVNRQGAQLVQFGGHAGEHVSVVRARPEEAARLLQVGLGVCPAGPCWADVSPACARVSVLSYRLRALFSCSR